MLKLISPSAQGLMYRSHFRVSQRISGFCSLVYFGKSRLMRSLCMRTYLSPPPGPNWLIIIKSGMEVTPLEGISTSYLSILTSGNNMQTQIYDVYLSNIPAIATENLLVLLLFFLFTTCFGPYGPSSGEIQLHHLHILKKPSILQRIRCFTIAHSYGVSLLLSTLQYI
jgi:hypothetical protein